jgi:hypothetical protein
MIIKATSKPSSQAHRALTLFLLPAVLVAIAGGCESSGGSRALTSSPATRVAIVDGQRVALGKGLAGPAPGGKPDAPPAAESETTETEETEKAPVFIPVIPMGDDATIARILDEGKNRNQVMNHLAHLSLGIGHRLTGSSQCEEANRWAMEQFAAWGLSNAHLNQWGTIAARFDRGPSTGRALIKRETTDREGNATMEDVEVAKLDFSTLAWVRGTDGPVKGQLVMMPRTEEEFSAVRDRLAGAWVLIGPEPGGRQGVRGVGGMMRARGGNWADVRKRVSDPALLAEAIEKRKQEAIEAQAKAAAPDDGISGTWAGTTTGPRMPNGGPLELKLEKSADGAITGTLSIGEYSTGEIKDAVLDGQTLKFSRSQRSGDRHYTLNIADGAMTGEGVNPADETTYTVELARGPAEAPPPIPEGPTIEEQILMAGPAGFISGSGDRRVWTTSADGWRELDPANLAQDVEINIAQPQFETLRELVERGSPVEAEFDLQHTFSQGPEGAPVPVYNTIAEIPGTEWPEQVVIVSGHLDSWNGPGSTGTIDNGTGSSVTLEAARILMAAGAKPKRTIRFILWTGEEQGLLGSRAYIEQIKNEMANISCVLVDDGGTNYEGGLGGTDDMVPMLANATAPVNDQFYSEIDGHWMNVNIRSTGDRMQGGGGSDHASFNAAGVPGFFWDEVGRANYSYGWHTQWDRLDQAIPEYLVQSSTCAAITAYNLACAPEMLPREKKEEAPAGN